MVFRQHRKNVFELWYFLFEKLQDFDVNEAQDSKIQFTLQFSVQPICKQRRR